MMLKNVALVSKGLASFTNLLYPKIHPRWASGALDPEPNSTSDLVTSVKRCAHTY